MNIAIIDAGVKSWDAGLIDKVADKIDNMCAYAGVPSIDVAGDALTYVYAWMQEYGETPDYDGVVRLACAKAKRLVQDAVRARNCDHGRKSVRSSLSLDATHSDDSTYCLYENASGMYSWKCRSDVEEQQHRYEIAWKVLDAVCKMRKISQVNLLIYKAAILHEMPREDVAKLYGTTRNNVDQVVARIKKGLAESGRKVYEEIESLAA